MDHSKYPQQKLLRHLDQVLHKIHQKLLHKIEFSHKTDLRTRNRTPSPVADQSFCRFNPVARPISSDLIFFSIFWIAMAIPPNFTATGPQGDNIPTAHMFYKLLFTHNPLVISYLHILKITL
ncbi:hypothetical protein GUJ93_ZPchr0004g39197 [Zizania palustris]|uniref:Uncharacterized protein n=1 Tax=Zizania palustris TaxID=103762 RepID=A0A8J5VZH0_ZIZPA|nr:hypothetical protein GUJ93_ZPchr0004g39197 [Zizania palustris]